jgi:hypothetical protein
MLIYYIYQHITHHLTEIYWLILKKRKIASKNSTVASYTVSNSKLRGTK